MKKILVIPLKENENSGRPIRALIDDENNTAGVLNKQQILSSGIFEKKFFSYLNGE